MVTAYVDYTALAFLVSQIRLPVHKSRVVHQALVLESLGVGFRHIHGESNVVADCLSRNPWRQSGEKRDPTALPYYGEEGTHRQWTPDELEELRTNMKEWRAERLKKRGTNQKAVAVRISRDFCLLAPNVHWCLPLEVSPVQEGLIPGGPPDEYGLGMGPP